MSPETLYTVGKVVGNRVWINRGTQIWGAHSSPWEGTVGSTRQEVAPVAQSCQGQVNDRAPSRPQQPPPLRVLGSPDLDSCPLCPSLNGPEFYKAQDHTVKGFMSAE